MSSINDIGLLQLQAENRRLRDKLRQWDGYNIEQVRKLSTELIDLHRKLANARTTIELTQGFCVAFRQDVPDWSRFPEVGKLFAVVSEALKEKP